MVDFGKTPNRIIVNHVFKALLEKLEGDVLVGWDWPSDARPSKSKGSGMSQAVLVPVTGIIRAQLWNTILFDSLAS